MFQPSDLVRRLKCHLDHRDDPFFYLHPVKIETLHDHPTIVIFHDIISPKEMKIIRFAAGPLVRIINDT